MSLFLDLWHVHYNLDFIKNHQSNTVDLIRHIDLAAMTFHTASRSPRHIKLSCFGVSLLSFLVLHLCHFLCFTLCECCLLDFSEFLLYFWCMLACRSTISIFIQNLTTATCMTLFFMNDCHCSDSFHIHACFPIFRILHLLYACIIIHSCLHSYDHAFKILMFSITCRLEYDALALTVPCPASASHF